MLSKLKIKYIQTLGQKKFREEERLFIAEGPKIIRELMGEPNVVMKEVFAVKEWIDLNKGSLQQTSVTEITGEELEKISQLSTPNQVLALVRLFEQGADITAKGHITLALETIQDPGNLGTIIRIADWFAVKQIVCSMDCADRYHPKVVQSTMGSIARVKVIYTDLTKWLSEQKDTRIYATTLEGQDVTTMKKITEGVILIGNESKGLGKNSLEFSHVRITVPGKGRAESLNAAVATGILLSHLT